MNRLFTLLSGLLLASIMVNFGDASIRGYSTYLFVGVNAMFAYDAWKARDWRFLLLYLAFVAVNAKGLIT